MSTSSSTSSGSGVARSHSRSRSRRSLPAPTPAVRGWIPSASNHPRSTITLDVKRGHEHDCSSENTTRTTTPRPGTGGKGKDKQKEEKTRREGSIGRLSMYSNAGSRGEPSTSTGGWGVSGFMSAALGVTAYRYLSGVQATHNVMTEITPEEPPATSRTDLPDPLTVCTEEVEASIQESPPPLASLSTDTSPDTGSFDWATLHRYERYRPPNRLSRLSNISHGSTLSSVFSFEPLTPDTPRTFALPNVHDTPTTPSKLPLPRPEEYGRNAGLGLDLGDGIEGEEEDIEPDPEGASEVLTRLDRMLIEIQVLTERGQAALAMSLVLPATPQADTR